MAYYALFTVLHQGSTVLPGPHTYLASEEKLGIKDIQLQSIASKIIIDFKY